MDLWFEEMESTHLKVLKTNSGTRIRLLLPGELVENQGSRPIFYSDPLIMLSASPMESASHHLKHCAQHRANADFEAKNGPERASTNQNHDFLDFRIF